MDKFDQQIKAAQQDYEPSGNFVETTMNKIHAGKRRSVGARIWMTGLAGAAAVALIVVMTGTGGIYKTALPAAPGSSNTDSNTANTALEADLQSVGQSMGQETRDQNFATSAIDDSSQQVQIPSN